MLGLGPFSKHSVQKKAVRQMFVWLLYPNRGPPTKGSARPPMHTHPGSTTKMLLLESFIKWWKLQVTYPFTHPLGSIISLLLLLLLYDYHHLIIFSLLIHQSFICRWESEASSYLFLLEKFFTFFKKKAQERKQLLPLNISFHR